MLAANSNAWAELYKWVDDKGKMHYSDKKPVEEGKTEVQSVKLSKKALSTDEPMVKAIIRPYERSARKLLLLDTTYGWRRNVEQAKDKKIGVYYAGKACLARGAMKFPEVFTRHKSFFPTETDITYRIKKIIQSLDYKAQKTNRYKLLKQLESSGGLSLHSDFVDLDFDTCAPSKDKFSKIKELSQISDYQFTKHRVKVKIRWQLKTRRDQQLIYETTTRGYYDGWHDSSLPREALFSAVENSTLKLFSDQDFINKILVIESVPDGLESPKDSIQSDVSPQSMPTSDPDSNQVSAKFNPYIVKAKLASALSEITQLKVGMTEYFYTHAKWPANLTDLGLSESMFSNSKTISDVIFQSDGSLVAELRNLFGEDKFLRMTPVLYPSGIAGISSWECSSNLQAQFLPLQCEAI
jgi:hypothetical protein